MRATNDAPTGETDASAANSGVHPVDVSLVGKESVGARVCGPVLEAPNRRAEAIEAELALEGEFRSC